MRPGADTCPGGCVHPSVSAGDCAVHRQLCVFCVCVCKPRGESEAVHPWQLRARLGMGWS